MKVSQMTQNRADDLIRSIVDKAFSSKDRSSAALKAIWNTPAATRVAFVRFFGGVFPKIQGLDPSVLAMDHIMTQHLAWWAFRDGSITEKKAKERMARANKALSKACKDRYWTDEEIDSDLKRKDPQIVFAPGS